MFFCKDDDLFSKGPFTNLFIKSYLIYSCCSKTFPKRYDAGCTVNPFECGLNNVRPHKTGHFFRSVIWIILKIKGILQYLF